MGCWSFGKEGDFEAAAAVAVALESLAKRHRLCTRETVPMK